MVVIEVGSNDGSDTQRWLDVGDTVYSFEPVPELHLNLKNRFKTYENYFPMPMAVDIVNGWAWFNIAAESAGCSSLYNFNPKINEVWAGRSDFVVVDRCRVPTIRLDTFMEVFSIPYVDYLWIDAQGNDLRVLQSMGNKIDNLKNGRCEVSFEVNLYDGPEALKNNHIEVTEWLYSNGFKTFTTVHHHKKEADIEFERV